MMKLIQELAAQYAPRSFNVYKVAGGYQLFTSGFNLGTFESLDAIRDWCREHLTPPDPAKQEQDLFANGCEIECEFNQGDLRKRLVKSRSGWKYWLTYRRNQAGAFVIERVESFDPRTHTV